MPVVLDTNVLLSMYVFKDSRHAAIRAAVERGRWVALTGAACLDEYRRVLAYPLFGLDGAARDAAFGAYAGIATAVSGPPRAHLLLPQCRDKDDQKFLELARDGGAALLVTADKALLALARRGRLRKLFRIVTPDMAVDLMAAGDSAIVGAGNGTDNANGNIR